ncbi:uncharacterized protein SPSK_10990 [Sporothrix schenckii 1099-18]|uniref:Alpha/beta hydrolase fold-3 domain-containing protein n=1 Tax=Sporothrix schenckii 1099-18 TaxID=1397361 RepID=A0A0F2LZZ8_SPOSC|nr:uncharacterized protein SPSK_10990 [Sporothrix schenckii 1099-18]KJR83033.1 hypothetical protein SPSK_10990 [Sporothrix schenckii 1099-18]
MPMAFAGLLGQPALPYPPLTDMLFVEDGSLENGPSHRFNRPRYSPSDAPLVVYYHGGGLLRRPLTRRTGGAQTLAAGAVVELDSVGYRLALELKAPTQVDDDPKGLG